MHKGPIQSRVMVTCQSCGIEHAAKRRDAKWCPPCGVAVRAEQTRQSGIRNRERRNEAAKRYVLQWTPEKRKRKQEQQRERLLKRNYGITQAEYDRMAQEQEGCCAICRDYQPVLFVDHNHSTGQVRGLLCSNCNFGIGSFEDSQEVLRRAIEYLDRQERISDVAEA